MARTVALIGKDRLGRFVNPLTGDELTCVADGVDIDRLVRVYGEMRDAKKAIIKKGKSEVRLSEMILAATDTAGGMLKAKIRFNEE